MYNIAAPVRSTLTKQIALYSSLNELSIDPLTVQIGRTESPLASFLFVLNSYGESVDGHGFAMVLFTIVVQALLDSTCGELELTR